MIEDSGDSSLPSENEGVKSSSQIAAELFRKVSVKYPASVTAQGIAIALECQVSEQNPAHLGGALTGNNTQLIELAETANKIHINIKKDKPVKKHGPPTDLTAEGVKRIVESDFAVAANVISFPSEELQKILNVYPKFMQLGNRDEALYTKFAETRLHTVRRKMEKEAVATQGAKKKGIIRRLVPHIGRGRGVS